jgi:hypothetical protein
MLSFFHQIRLAAGARLQLQLAQGRVPTAAAYPKYPEKSRVIQKLFPSILVVPNAQPSHRLGLIVGPGRTRDWMSLLQRLDATPVA